MNILWRLKKEEKNEKKMKKKILAVLSVTIVSLSLTACENKQDKYDKAVNAFKEGKFQKSEKIFEELGDYEDSSDYVEKNLYSMIKDELSRTDNLLEDYFSDSYYNINKLNESKEAAETAVSSSKKDSYIDTFENLKKANNEFEEFIQGERDKLYNEQTHISEEAPFEVDTSELPENWDFKPTEKQSSAYPVWIITHESYTTDTPAGANLFIDNQSAEYTFDVHSVETKEIDVKDKDGSITKALVNIKVIFTVQPDYEIFHNPLIQDQCILLKRMLRLFCLFLVMKEKILIFLMYQ